MPSQARLEPPTDSSSSGTDATTDEEITSTTTLSKKRKKALADACKLKGKHRKAAQPLKDYIKFARWYTRSQDIEPNWFLVLDKGMAYSRRNYGSLTPVEFLQKYGKPIEIYQDMLASIPLFEAEAEHMRGNPTVSEAVAKAMIAGSGAARSEDISSLKHAVIVYTMRHQVGEKLEPPIRLGSCKAGTRGHHHIQLSRLICPAIFLDDFDREPEEFRKKLLRGKVLIRARDWPSFFWPQNSYDPEHLFDGLLRNPVLVLVFKHIFTSPSSAMADDSPLKTRTKASQARINRMECVTYGSIAYVCVLYRFCISDVPDWRIKDRVYDWRELYDEVIGIMQTAEKDDPDWLKDLLKFWNENIFGDESRNSDDPDAAQLPPSSMSILKQQRLAKTAALAERQPSLDNEEPAPHTPPGESEVDEDFDENSGSPRRRTSREQLHEHRHEQMQPMEHHSNRQQNPNHRQAPFPHPTQHQPPNPTLDEYPPAGYLPTPFNSQRQFSDMSPRSQWTFHNAGGPPYIPNPAERPMYQHLSGFSGRGPTLNNNQLRNQPDPSMYRNNRGSNSSEPHHTG